MPWQIFDGRKSKRTKAKLDSQLIRLSHSQSAQRCGIAQFTGAAAAAAVRQYFPNSKITNGAIEPCFGLLRPYYSVVDNKEQLLRYQLDSTKLKYFIVLLCDGSKL